MHGRFLSGGAGTVDAFVVPDELPLVVFTHALVGTGEPTGAGLAHLPGHRAVQDVRVSLGLGLLPDLRLLLSAPFVDGLPSISSRGVTPLAVTPRGRSGGE